MMHVFVWIHLTGGEATSYEGKKRTWFRGNYVTANDMVIISDCKEQAEAYQPKGTMVGELDCLPQQVITLKEWKARHILCLIGGAVFDHLADKDRTRQFFEWAENPDLIPLKEFGTHAPFIAAERAQKAGAT